MAVDVDRARSGPGTVSASPDGLHPRNAHRGRYDFARLQQDSPELTSFVRQSPRGETTIDFADPAAVLALNRALLRTFYGVRDWSVPAGFLCPPIPGRADYVHYLADLLAADCSGEIPRGPTITALDVGVGANCIYPIVGRHEYDWNFVGSETDAAALRAATRTIEANENLRGRIACRQQPNRAQIFRGVIRPDDRFAVTLCNPPFHASAAEANESTRSKQQNLARSRASVPLRRNFGGQPNELWCPGGEVAFVRQMIRESREFAAQCVWFTSLVSSRDSLPALERELQRIGAIERRTIPMAQGQKRSRALAWTFHDAPSRSAALRQLSRAKVSGT